MIELFDFQHRAVAQIAHRFVTYMGNRPGKIVGKTTTFFPFYQALASITASGKTVVMAETVNQLLPVLPLKPIVIWLSKGRVVVDQTYANLQDGGRYRHLLSACEVRLLADFDVALVEDENVTIVYLATVGTFNQKDKDASKLRLFKSDIDNADRSTWEALKRRLTANQMRRPLLVVYDEAHNLTDQQTDLLMELEPDAFLLASATHKLPQAIVRVTDDLKGALSWSDADLTTYVSSKDVVAAGLVKRGIVLGGYQATMAETIDDLLADMHLADEAVSNLGLSLSPKAIYVCRTNITEGNANQLDDPKRPFAQRQAPPIRIWTYLVKKGIDPARIAVYTSALKFDKDHPPPADFVHFKGGDNDYSNFIAGNYRHIIFNLGLQEGWDDSECYFAYIDKSMHSNVQVEQVIGRVLRQPAAQHYESETLNTAHFYVRIDARGVFQEIVQEVGKRLGGDLPEIQISSYEAGQKNRPIAYPVKQARQVPHVYRDPSAAQSYIDQIITRLIDFRKDTTNVRGAGAKGLVQRQIGSDHQAELVWVEREHGNAVTARWIFQTAVRRQFPLALEVTRSDDPKLDALVEFGSPAADTIRKAAEEVVQTYLEHVVLKQRQHNPFVVGEIAVDPTAAESFANALHRAYSGLNKSLELPFAKELDKLKLSWCRNPSRSGFGIPLLSLGQSKSFYPDFLVWKDNYVFALDTTGEHILEDKLGRKLLHIEPHPKAKLRLMVRLVSRGRWDDEPQRGSGDGFTVWTLGHANELKPIHTADLGDAVQVALRTST